MNIEDRSRILAVGDNLETDVKGGRRTVPARCWWPAAFIATGWGSPWAISPTRNA